MFYEGRENHYTSRSSSFTFQRLQFKTSTSFSSIHWDLSVKRDLVFGRPPDGFLPKWQGRLQPLSSGSSNYPIPLKKREALPEYWRLLHKQRAYQEGTYRFSRSNRAETDYNHYLTQVGAGRVFKLVDKSLKPVESLFKIGDLLDGSDTRKSEARSC